jgi:hypothetical protein
LSRRAANVGDDKAREAINRMARNLTTTGNDEPLACNVHTILLSIGPDAIDRDIAIAIELLSPGQTDLREPDDFRLDVFIAVQSVAEAISSHELYSERNRLLLHAVNCARSWLNARRFQDAY